jgi:hypothetical protein
MEWWKGAKRRRDLSLGCQAQEMLMNMSSAESVADTVAAITGSNSAI